MTAVEQVQEALRNIPRTFSPEDPLQEIIDYFCHNPDFNTAVVQDTGGKVLGVVTRNGLLQHLSQRADKGTPIRGLVSQEYHSVKMGDGDPETLLDCMDNAVEDLLVVDDRGRYVTLTSCCGVYSFLRERLRVLKGNYDAVLNSTYDGIIAIDSQGKVTVFNQAAGTMLGHDHERAIGMDVTDLIPNTRLPDILRSGKPELRQKYKEGDKTFVANRTPIFSNDGIIGAISVFQDITSEEELLSQLVDTRQFVDVMELILDNAYVGIIFCDPNGIIRFMNRIYEELLGIDRDTAIGKHITEYFQDSRLPLVIKSGKPELGWKYSFRGRTLILNRIPIKKGGHVIGVIAQCIFKDISELKQLVSKLDILETKVRFYKRELTDLLAPKYTLDDILGNSEAITNLKKLTLLYARTEAPVLIMGDTGTGKELFAHAIHGCSGRLGGPIVCVNSASIPKELLESELFGYAPGAFTGAHHKGKIGKIELADGGTLFLDEIGDLPLSAQAKLLRVIEEKRVERVGDVHPIEVDFRLVAATNQNLDQLVKDGKFREDLYYRLGTMTLFVPTLKSRSEDIPLLIHDFLRKTAGRELQISDHAMQILTGYGWPGNIRELRNVMERALSLLDQDEVIDSHHLPSHMIKNTFTKRVDPEAPEMVLKGIVWEHEEKTIRAALTLCKGKKVHAARTLGISRSVLYSKMKRYGIPIG
jgi:PAS domain S-box-containing protein